MYIYYNLVKKIDARKRLLSIKLIFYYICAESVPVFTILIGM
jgi:hypothetical protein